MKDRLKKVTVCIIAPLFLLVAACTGIVVMGERGMIFVRAAWKNKRWGWEIFKLEK